MSERIESAARAATFSIRVGLRLAARTLFALALGLPLTGHSGSIQPGTRVEAIWKMHRVNFIFQGDYSCIGLQEKLRILLRSVGARSTMALQTAACEARDGIVRVRLTFESPAQAGDREAVPSSRDQLIARLHGQHAAAPGRFTAVWKSISFRDRKLGLKHGDCPLVQHLRDFVLPELAVQVTRDDLRCWNQFSRAGAPALAVLALVAEPENG